MTLIFCSRINSKGCSKHIMSMALYLRNFGWKATGLNLINLSIFFFRLTHVIGMDTISSCTMISGMQARALSHSSIGMYFFQNFFIILLCLVENSNCWGKKKPERWECHVLFGMHNLLNDYNTFQFPMEKKL